jgi:hypothetical protein
MKSNRLYLCGSKIGPSGSTQTDWIVCPNANVAQIWVVNALTLRVTALLYLGPAWQRPRLLRLMRGATILAGRRRFRILPSKINGHACSNAGSSCLAMGAILNAWHRPLHWIWRINWGVGASIRPHNPSYCCEVYMWIA